MNAYAQKEQKAEKDKTGIPAQMKAKFERSSGFSFDDVRVHYNSEKPAQLHAHAYTQGSEVFVAPGQEKHLPHELGHVVQQKSNEVKPTGEVGGMPLNDDEAMEDGADKLAEEAESSEESDEAPLQAKAKDGGVIQKADLYSEGSYNFNAGFMSSIIGGMGILGALGSFAYSKHNARKHKYIDEIEKYADAACDAREEQIAAKEVYDNSSDLEKVKARAEVIKLGAKVKRNYKAAVDKTHAWKGTLTWDYIKGPKPNTKSRGIQTEDDQTQDTQTEDDQTQDTQTQGTQRDVPRDKKIANMISDENARNAITRADEAYVESEKTIAEVRPETSDAAETDTSDTDSFDTLTL